MGVGAFRSLVLEDLAGPVPLVLEELVVGLESVKEDRCRRVYSHRWETIGTSKRMGLGAFPSLVLEDLAGWVPLVLEELLIGLESVKEDRCREYVPWAV